MWVVDPSVQVAFALRRFRREDEVLVVVRDVQVVAAGADDDVRRVAAFVVAGLRFARCRVAVYRAVRVRRFVFDDFVPDSTGFDVQAAGPMLQGGST